MRKLVWAGGFIVLAGLAGIWMLRGPSGSDPRAQASDSPNWQEVEAPPGTVTLAHGAAKRMGLEVTVLKPVRHAEELRTNAVVLPAQGLANLAAAYVAETEKLAVARASLAVARSEYERQNKLYKENQTTSLKALQAARGALASSQAETSGARRQLQLDALDVEQQWGPVLRKWMVAHAPAFERILHQREWLVQLTLGAGSGGRRPDTVRLLAPAGATVTARLLSAFPQTNPVIQGLNFLYVIPARPGFAPGLNLVAEIPVGRPRRGVVLPAGAVVWSGGEAWAYKETAANRFQRLIVSTDAPVSGGWFVTTGFSPGDRVVTRATEELFSAETQPAGGGEGDDD